MIKLESMSLSVGFNDGTVGVLQLKSPVPNGWFSVLDMLLDQVATDSGVDDLPRFFKAVKRHLDRRALGAVEFPKMSLVTSEDANAFCRILSVLGMEEEGDPVAAVEALLSAAS